MIWIYLIFVHIHNVYGKKGVLNRFGPLEQPDFQQHLYSSFLSLGNGSNELPVQATSEELNRLHKDFIKSDTGKAGSQVITRNVTLFIKGKHKDRIYDIIISMEMYFTPEEDDLVKKNKFDGYGFVNTKLRIRCDNHFDSEIGKVSESIMRWGMKEFLYFKTVIIDKNGNITLKFDSPDLKDFENIHNINLKDGDALLLSVKINEHDDQVEQNIGKNIEHNAKQSGQQDIQYIAQHDSEPDKAYNEKVTNEKVATNDASTLNAATNEKVTNEKVTNERETNERETNEEKEADDAADEKAAAKEEENEEGENGKAGQNNPAGQGVAQQAPVQQSPPAQEPHQNADQDGNNTEQDDQKDDLDEKEPNEQQPAEQQPTQQQPVNNVDNEQDKYDIEHNVEHNEYNENPVHDELQQNVLQEGNHANDGNVRNVEHVDLNTVEPKELYNVLERVDVPEGTAIPIPVKIYFPIKNKTSEVMWVLLDVLLFYSESEYNNLTTLTYPDVVSTVRRKLFNRVSKLNIPTHSAKWVELVSTLTVKWFYGNFSYEVANLTKKNPSIIVRGHLIHKLQRVKNIDEYNKSITYDGKTIIGFGFIEAHDFKDYSVDFIIPKYGSQFETSEGDAIHKAIVAVEHRDGEKVTLSIRYLIKHVKLYWFVYTTEMYLTNDELARIGDTKEVTQTVLEVLQNKLLKRVEEISAYPDVPEWFVVLSKVAVAWMGGNYTKGILYFDHENKLGNIMVENITERKLPNFSTFTSYVRNYACKYGTIANFSVDKNVRPGLSTAFTLNPSNYDFNTEKIPFMVMPKIVEPVPYIIKSPPVMPIIEHDSEPDKAYNEKVTNEKVTNGGKENSDNLDVVDQKPENDELTKELGSLPKIEKLGNARDPIVPTVITGLIQGIKLGRDKVALTMPAIEALINELPASDSEFVLNVDNIALNSPIGQLWKRALVETGHIAENEDVIEYLKKHTFNQEMTLLLLNKIYGDLTRDTYANYALFYETANIPKDVVVGGDVNKIKEMYANNVGVQVTRIPPLIKVVAENFIVPNIILSLTSQDLISRLQLMFGKWLDANKTEEELENDAHLAVLCISSAVFVQNWMDIQVDQGYELASEGSAWMRLFSVMNRLPKKLAKSPSAKLCKKYISGAGAILSRGSNGIVVQNEPKSLIASVGNVLGISMGNPTEIANAMHVYIGWMLKSGVKNADTGAMTLFVILHMLKAFNKCFAIKDNKDYQIYTAQLLFLDSDLIFDHMANNETVFNSIPMLSKVYSKDSAEINEIFKQLFAIVSTNGHQLLMEARRFASENINTDDNLLDAGTNNEGGSAKGSAGKGSAGKGSAGRENGGKGNGGINGGKNPKEGGIANAPVEDMVASPENTPLNETLKMLQVDSYEPYPWIEDPSEPVFVEYLQNLHIDDDVTPSFIEQVYKDIKGDKDEMLINIKVQIRVSPTDPNDELVVLNTSLHLHPKEIEIANNNSNKLWDVLLHRFKRRLMQFVKKYTPEAIDAHTQLINGEKVTKLHMIHGALDVPIYEWLVNVMELVLVDGYYFQIKHKELPHVLPSDWVDQAKTHGLIVQLVDPCPYHLAFDGHTTYLNGKWLLESDRLVLKE